MMMPRTMTVCLLTLLFLATGLPAAPAAGAEDTVCIQCHGGQPGPLGEPVPEWRGSIHAANGISCHGCHGGDPSDFAMAMSPDRGFTGVPENDEIPDFCGRCHVGVREDYLESAHGRALEAGGPQCVTCHGNHGVVKASLDLINPKDCSRCHEYGRAEVIKAAMGETDQRIGALEQDLARLRRVGIDTKAMDGDVFSLRNRFHRLFHSVEVEKVRRQTAEVQEELDKVRGKVAAVQEELSRRKTAGGIVVGLLVLAGILALLVRKTYEEEETGRG
jgi:hypothetical protein